MVKPGNDFQALGSSVSHHATWKISKEEGKTTMQEGKQARIFVLKSPRKILSSPEAQLMPHRIISDN